MHAKTVRKLANLMQSYCREALRHRLFLTKGKGHALITRDESLAERHVH